MRLLTCQARGRITAHVERPEIHIDQEIPVKARLTDSKGVLVAQITCFWTVRENRKVR